MRQLDISCGTTITFSTEPYARFLSPQCISLPAFLSNSYPLYTHHCHLPVKFSSLIYSHDYLRSPRGPFIEHLRGWGRDADENPVIDPSWTLRTRRMIDGIYLLDVTWGFWCIEAEARTCKGRLHLFSCKCYCIRYVAVQRINGCWMIWVSLSYSFVLNGIQYPVHSSWRLTVQTSQLSLSCLISADRHGLSRDENCEKCDKSGLNTSLRNRVHVSEHWKAYEDNWGELIQVHQTYSNMTALVSKKISR